MAEACQKVLGDGFVIPIHLLLQPIMKNTKIMARVPDCKVCYARFGCVRGEYI